MLDCAEGLPREMEDPSPRSGHCCDIRERAEAILRTEVDFVTNASFIRCDDEAENSILTSPAAVRRLSKVRRLRQSIARSLSSIVRSPRAYRPRKNELCFEL